MAETKLGEILDGLGVALELEDGDLVADAIVVLKIVTAEGRVQVGVANSETASWLDQLGLLTAAADITRSGTWDEPRNG